MFKLLIFCLIFVGKANCYDPLGRYNVDSSDVTISGFSSGGFMTVQMQYMHSKVFRGSGTFAGGPYGLEAGAHISPHASAIEFTKTLAPIVLGMTNEIDRMEALVSNFSNLGLIDDVSNLRGIPIYVYHGVLDPIVNHGYSVTIAKMYKDFGANVVSNLDVWSTHGVPTDNFGGWCKIIAPNHNFLNDCGFEGVFDLFQTIYGSSYIAPASSTIPYTGSLTFFDQAEFTPNRNAAAIELETRAHVYVPLKCQDVNTICRVHVALHGCSMTAVDVIENDFSFVTNAGYLQAADANNVIVIFPRVLLSLDPFNGGCWDMYGYTNSEYLWKSAKQPMAIMGMLQRLGVIFD